MTQFQITVASDGTLVLPPHLRRHLQIETGGHVLIREEDGRVVLESFSSATSHAQAIVRRYAPDAHDVVDEFLAERRADAARE